jgi:hypothetical protein
LPERTYELTFLHELEGDAREGWHPSEPPLLARITESDRNGTKKIPTRFRWTRGGQGFSRLEPGASLGSALSDEELEQVGEGLLVGTGSHVGDFDNDGRQEGFSCRQPVARYGEEEEGLELGYLEVHRQGGQWWWSRDREEGERGAPREYGCCPWHIDALDREWKDLDHNGFTDPGHGSPLEDVDGDGFLDLVYLTGEDAKWKHSSRDEDWRNWGTTR